MTGGSVLGGSEHRPPVLPQGAAEPVYRIGTDPFCEAQLDLREAFARIEGHPLTPRRHADDLRLQNRWSTAAGN